MTTRDAGYDDFLDSVEAGEPYYLESASGEAYLPPMPYDPETGDPEMQTQPLPETGELLTHTTTNVAAPEFVDDAPYVTAIAAFGPVRLTGQVDAEPETVEIGQEVALAVTHSETTGERVLTFTPE